MHLIKEAMLSKRCFIVTLKTLSGVQMHNHLSSTRSTSAYKTSSQCLDIHCSIFCSSVNILKQKHVVNHASLTISCDLFQLLSIDNTFRFWPLSLLLNTDVLLFRYILKYFVFRIVLLCSKWAGINTNTTFRCFKLLLLLLLLKFTPFGMLYLIFTLRSNWISANIWIALDIFIFSIVPQTHRKAMRTNKSLWD